MAHGESKINAGVPVAEVGGLKFGSFGCLVSALPESQFVPGEESTNQDKCRQNGNQGRRASSHRSIQWQVGKGGRLPTGLGTLLAITAVSRNRPPPSGGRCAWSSPRRSGWAAVAASRGFGRCGGSG